MRQVSLRSHYLLLAAISLGILGCAGATITPEQAPPPPQATTARTTRPDQVIVYDFAVSPNDVTQNQSVFARAYRGVASTPEDTSKDELGHQVAQALSARLVEDLRAMGLNAVQMPRGTAPSGNVLAIDGQFVDIDEGNRLRRLAIGFGAGASKVDTRVQIYDVASSVTEPITTFTTHADSGKMPGAIIAGPGAAAGGSTAIASGAIGATSGGVRAVRSTSVSLGNMTADQISAYFSQYAASRGWISADAAKKAKVREAQAGEQH